MDMWLYYEATHAPLRYMNPTTEQTMRELEEVLDLQAGRRVLDIACGHASMLLDFARRYGVSGVGVDASPYTSRRAQERAAAEPDLDVTIAHGLGEEFQVAADERFDVVSCVGASWIWKGWEGTLDALVGFTRPGGLIIAGEPFWQSDPPAPYLESQGLQADEFPTLAAYAEGVWGRGLKPIWMHGASEQEWDRYEMLQAWALDGWTRANPDHPDRSAIEARHRQDKRAYLTWGRGCVGFAIWVIRVPGD